VGRTVLVKPLDQSFGAEVRGLSQNQLLDPDVASVLRNALHEHLLLIVRDQRLSVAGQVNLARIFGQPEKAWDVKSHHPESPYVQVMNSASRPAAADRTSSQFWHTDGSFLPCPTLTTILAIQELPREGGDTLFVNTRSAYQELPESLRERVRNAYLRFSYRHQLLGFQAAKYGSEYNPETDYPDVLHPLVRRHPATGRGSLYLDQLCVSGVAGWVEDESRDLLDRLYAHTITERRIYQHVWRDGDLLIWDNPTLMHRRGAHHQGSRLLYRTSIAGPAPIMLADEAA
jgi:taurine dioxygenase